MRRKAMQKICESPTPRALEAMRNALDDEDVEVRRMAVAALAKLEDDSRLDPLLAALKDRDPEVLQTAIGALKRFDETRVIAALVPLIFHTDAGVRGRAVQSLEYLGWKPTNPDEEIWHAVAKYQMARAATYGIAALPALECVLRGGPYNLRIAAIEAIGEIPDKRAMRPLLAALKSPDPTVCSAAVEVLGRMGDPETIGPIVGALHHADAHVRATVAETLGRMDATAAIEPLRAGLRDSNWEVRRATVGALGRLRDKASVSALTVNLDDPDQDVRETAALALGNIGDRQAIGPLVKALKDGQSSVRRIAAATLSRIDENWGACAEAQQAITELKSSLDDKDPEMRHLVGRLLTSLGQELPNANKSLAGEELTVSSIEKRRKLAASLFRAILCDEDRDLRRAAAESLGRMGDKHAHAALTRAQGDVDESVRSAAEGALHAIEAQLTAA